MARLDEILTIHKLHNRNQILITLVASYLTAFFEPSLGARDNEFGVQALHRGCELLVCLDFSHAIIEGNPKSAGRLFSSSNFPWNLSYLVSESCLNP